MRVSYMSSSQSNIIYGFKQYVLWVLWLQLAKIIASWHDSRVAIDKCEISKGIWTQKQHKYPLNPLQD